METSGTSLDKFSLDKSGCGACGSVFMFQASFQRDGFQHLSESVYSNFS